MGGACGGSRPVFMSLSTLVSACDPTRVECWLLTAAGGILMLLRQAALSASAFSLISWRTHISCVCV